jgi:hypothetical protein
VKSLALHNLPLSRSLDTGEQTMKLPKLHHLSIVHLCHRDLSIITCTQWLSRILNTISCSLNLFFSLFIAKYILELIGLVLFLLYISFFLSFSLVSCGNSAEYFAKAHKAKGTFLLCIFSPDGKKFNCEIFLYMPVGGTAKIHIKEMRASP